MDHKHSHYQLSIVNCQFLLLLVLLAASLLVGTVSIPPAQLWTVLFGSEPLSGDSAVYATIVWQSRLPQAVTAMLAGAALAVAGLEMQTVFHNPLAGPSVLGISSGASLGVALVVLLAGTLGGSAMIEMGYVGEVALYVAAAAGALTVMGVIALLAERVESNVTLLIIGVMAGYMASAVIGVLKFFSDEQDVRAFVVWGLGSFSRVSGTHLYVFAALIMVLLPLSFFLAKPMNLLTLGDGYARNLGLNIRRARRQIIVSSGLLVAVVTAYCGPILFLGLAVPHLCRAMLSTGDRRVLLPACMLTGAALALLCALIARLPGIEGALPVNSVTALIGAPVVVSVLMKRKS